MLFVGLEAQLERCDCRKSKNVVLASLLHQMPVSDVGTQAVTAATIAVSRVPTDEPGQISEVMGITLRLSVSLEIKILSALVMLFLFLLFLILVLWDRYGKEIGELYTSPLGTNAQGQSTCGARRRRRIFYLPEVTDLLLRIHAETKKTRLMLLYQIVSNGCVTLVLGRCSRRHLGVLRQRSLCCNLNCVSGWPNSTALKSGRITSSNALAMALRIESSCLRKTLVTTPTNDMMSTIEKT
ncbi:hypothetical protein Plhal710r2_c031g0115401 [Plasmopara halstedii]